jgi:hypothetical protein
MIILASAKAGSSGQLSDLEIALLTGVFTLVAAVLGFVGAGILQARVSHQEKRAQYERLISEAMSAAEEVSNAASIFREKLVISFPRGLADAAGQAVINGNFQDIKLENLSWSTALSLFGLGYGLSGRADTARDLQYLQFVSPALRRLTTALTPLRIGKEPQLAEMAIRLTEASNSLAKATVERRKRYLRAYQEWNAAYADFVAIARSRVPK